MTVQYSSVWFPNTEHAYLTKPDVVPRRSVIFNSHALHNADHLRILSPLDTTSNSFKSLYANFIISGTFFSIVVVHVHYSNAVSAFNCFHKSGTYQEMEEK